MIEVPIPPRRTLRLEHLVLDYNGTLAADGELLDGVREAIEELSQHLHIRVLTADTFGKAREQLADLPVEVTILAPEYQDKAKWQIVDSLGASRTVCIGNGRNDSIMLKEAALGIAVVQAEGAATGALRSADIICRSITDALALLANPLRLAATLRY